jgi:copper oxidase (laccase) domain-containing protein
VGADYRTRFIDSDSSYADFFIPSQRQDHFLFDLPGFIGLRLRAAGIGSFSDLALDTYAREDLFYSYRRMTHRGEADYGRQIAAIALV